MDYNWNWGFLFDQVQSGDETYIDWLVMGLGWTIAVALSAWVIAFVLGSIVGTLRTTPSKTLVALGNAYTEFFRNVPILAQLFIWFFVIPELLPREWGLWVKQDMPAKEFFTATIALGLFTSARVSEQVRAGIQSISTGQRNAALAMGLTLPQAYRHVVLPVAFRIIIPPLTSEFMNAFKNSAVAYAIGVFELTFVSRQMVEESGQVIESLLAATILYFLCALTINRLMGWTEKRVRIPGFISAK